MKKLRLLSVCLTLSACASDPFLVVDENPALTTFDGLHPVQTNIFANVWVRTPLDLSRFDKLLLEEAKSFYRYVPKSSPTTPSRSTPAKKLAAQAKNVALPPSTRATTAPSGKMMVS